MQYIVGANQVIALALPEHRKWEDSHEGKVWNHVHTDDTIVMYHASVDMSFLGGTIAQIIAEAKDSTDVVKHLSTLSEIPGVNIHAMILEHRDQQRGRSVENGDLWFRYYDVHHYKKLDNGKFGEFKCQLTNNYLYDFDITYGIPEYMIQYLDRRTYEARRNQPGENQANHDESMEWARVIVRRECMDHMLNPQFHEITIQIPEYEEFRIPTGTKPNNHKAFYQP